MIAYNCYHYVGDEECNKCMLHGFVCYCDDCDDYTKSGKQEEDDD